MEYEDKVKDLSLKLEDDEQTVDGLKRELKERDETIGRLNQELQMSTETAKEDEQKATEMDENLKIMSDTKSNDNPPIKIGKWVGFPYDIHRHYLVKRILYGKDMIAYLNAFNDCDTLGDLKLI